MLTFTLIDFVTLTVNFYMCYNGWQTDWIGNSVGNVMAIVDPLYDPLEDLDVHREVFRAILENLQVANINRNTEYDWEANVELWCDHFLRGKESTIAPAA